MKLLIRNRRTRQEYPIKSNKLTYIGWILAIGSFVNFTLLIWRYGW